MTSADGVIIRPVLPDDVAFVVNGWLEGYWPDCPCSLVMPKAEWWRRWHGVVENALADQRNRNLVACSADNETFLFGFIVARPPSVLHWIYVKQTFRGNGIAHALQAGSGLKGPVRFSSWSEGARRMAFANRDLSYDPRLIKEYA